MQESESKQLNPWITIWTRPRETLRSLIQRSPERYILLLSILNGVIASLSSYIFFG